MKIRSLLISVLIILLGCKTIPNEEDLASESSEFKALKTLVDSRNLVFEAQVAYPFQTNDIIDVSNELMSQTENANGRFSLSANEDYLELKHHLNI